MAERPITDYYSRKLSPSEIEELIAFRKKYADVKDDNSLKLLLEDRSANTGRKEIDYDEMQQKFQELISE